MKNLKRVLSLALSTVMLFGMMVVGTSAADYADVAATDNVEAIEVLKAVGVMEGDDKGNFNPDQTVTRNEMAVVMANLLGLSVDNYDGSDLPFTDVPAWAAKYVAACYANGIVSGTSATTYGGNATVTAAQAGLMMMKALGYFQFAPDFGDDWQLATVKQASKINLYDDIEAGATTALTRNEVAQLALNTLMADVVEYTGSQGTDITTTDGTTIKIGYTIRYYVDDTYTAKDFTPSDALGDGTKQLCEQLYGNDLSLVIASDDFGADSNNWTYDSKPVGKYSVDADLTYTATVKEKALYADLGLSTNASDWNIIVDGNPTVSGTQTIRKGDSTDIPGTANGALTSVYTDSKRIVIVNTYAGEVSSIDDENANGEREITLTSTEGAVKYETELFAEDDIVLFTYVDSNGNGVWNAGEDVKSITLADNTVTGKITKTVGTSSIYVDGSEYKCNAANNWDPDGVAVKDTVTLYLNEYGYIVGMTEVASEVSLNDLALFVSGGPDRSAGYAKLIFADGTTKIVDTKVDYTASGSFDANNDGDKADGASDALSGSTIVKFEVEDGVYELKYANSVSAGSVTVTKGNPTVNVATDDETVFVYGIDTSATPDGVADEFKVFTGYKNIMGGSSATVTSYTKTGSSVADLVYVELAEGNLTTTAADMTVIAFKDTNGLVVEDEMSYYEYNAVVDGEVTTVKVVPGAWVTMNGNDYYAVNGLTYDSDEIGTLGVAWTPTDVKTGSTDKIKYSGNVVTIDGTAFAYADDVKVIVVDDGDISVIDVEDIVEDNDVNKDPYKTVTYKVNSTDTYVVEVIILVKN